MGLIVIATVDASGRDDPDRRSSLFHRSDLNGRSVRSEHVRIPVFPGAVDEKCIMLLARRVFGRHVEGVEVVPIIFDLRTLRDVEAHVGEYCRHFFEHLANRMNRPGPPLAPRKGHVQPFLLQTSIERHVREFRLALGGRFGDLVLDAIERWSGLAPLFRIHCPERPESLSDFSLSPKRGDTCRFNLGFAGGIPDFREVMRSKGFDFA